MANPPGISQSVYDDLVRYTKYSSGAYQILCPRPMGNTLVLQFTDVLTSTQGFVVRDDKRKEIIVAFRGSQNISHVLLDSQILMSPLNIPGLSQADDARVHSGFLFAFNSVASTVLNTVKVQFNAHPAYSLISTGHSLGGSLASIGAISMKSNFPNAHVKLFTFGQPRTGNGAFATLVEHILSPSNIFRAVHTFDGVPTMLSPQLGYVHHATEYWQFIEPPSPKNVKQCSGGEDPDGSASVPTTGINIPHMVYFGQAISLDPTVCL
ncbi:hypothetical protein SERLADRAFT_388749 [Serpula lacrymans var. lacrymans S7.9]|uniref:Fungal lipase-type domain-containing protein n=1 Tax=Serpula lacrymans var. lacrymans (strain S7.9) TaxID=578457 RepID=F8NV28_SERL9|nr:uncharacterized protein SERLADRAFT_388749 [Serpula lacrymans var. lacrymans S7.9]EGO25983.1 hypothetical protein SERLADRAFT_388749 [Serpula lacrymans var. lacrymans S7.9]